MSGQSAESGSPSSTSARTPQATPASGSKRWLWIGGLGCLGILGLCALIGIVALVVDSDDNEEDVAGDSTEMTSETTETALGDEPAEVTSEANETAPADEPTEPASEDVPDDEPTEVPDGGDPTPTVESIESPTPQPGPELDIAGAGRSNPVPFGDVGTTADSAWQSQINEVFRGDDAWQRILEANQFNDPPAEGMEYVLVNVTMTYFGDDTEAQTVSSWDFTSTGDARVRWRTPSVVHPEPELSGELFSGGEVTGWVVLHAREGESNLLAIYEPPFSMVEGDEIFIALEEGASVEPLMERTADINDLGSNREDPAQQSEHVVTDIWEIWINEVIRGDEAWTVVEQSNQFNDPPATGMEYIAVRAGARNVKAGHGSDSVTTFMFESTGDSNVVHDTPSVVHPDPELRFDVYAGGEVEGWVILQSQEGEGNVSLVFTPSVFGAESRYISLE